MEYALWVWFGGRAKGEDSKGEPRLFPANQSGLSDIGPKRMFAEAFRLSERSCSRRTFFGDGDDPTSLWAI
jgi:hypothetical protein